MKFTWCNKVSYQRNVDLGIDPECHECSSHWRDMSGYPRIEVNKRIWKMHRWIYLQHTGESPEVVMHLCDNRACININHLRGGTHYDNAKDRSDKGRGKVRLNRGSALLIKEKISSGCTDIEIASQFGVDRRTIYDIRKGNTWRAH